MSFKDYEVLNLVQQIEQNGSEKLAAELAACAPKIEEQLQSNSAAFKHKAISRARQLAEISGLNKQYQKASRRYNSVTLVLCLVMAALGFLAVQQTLAVAKSELNVYWLLLLIVGINAVSMLLWLVYIARSMFDSTPTLNQSPLLRAFKRVQQFINQRSSKASLFTAWSESFLSGPVGKWFTSQQLHAAWLLYLAGGLLALLITLAGKQYDFVWGTTILSSELFVRATEALGVLPSALGFAVPSADQILASEMNSEQPSIDGLRSVWASFIFGCVALYAVLPRFILWAGSALATRWAKSKYQVDWEQPYYYSLRSRMLPQSSSLGVIDPDTENGKSGLTQSSVTDLATTKLDDLVLPQNAYVAAFEWGADSKPTLTVDKPIDLGEIDTAHEQTGMLQAVRQSPKSVIIMVPLERAADRGAARFLKDIAKLSELHLVIVKRKNTLSDAARLAGWQAVVEKMELPNSQFHFAEML